MPSAEGIRAAEEIRQILRLMAEGRMDAERAMRQAIAELQRETVTLLAHIVGFRADRMRQALAGIRALEQEYAQEATRRLQPGLRTAATLGEELVDRPLRLTLMPGAVSRTVLESATGVTASLIQDISAEAARAIRRQVTLAATGVKSFAEIVQGIAGSLDDPSVFGSLAARAEAIARTEVGRVAAISAQGRQEQAVQRVPDLEKMWTHGAIRPLSRPSHVAMHGQVRAVDEDFDLPPIAVGRRGAVAESAPFPRHPSLSAVNSVNCLCHSVPHRAAWELEAGELQALGTSRQQRAMIF